MKSPAQLADVFGGEFPLAAQNLGDYAGCAKDVKEVSLLELIGCHEFFQCLDGSGRFQGIVPFFKIFD